ncbi:MAG TPA: SMP-30/gluconolactonase/LRE family protein [Caulobacteraceae bacterium]|jgi:hypothetical protein
MPLRDHLTALLAASLLLGAGAPLAQDQNAGVRARIAQLEGLVPTVRDPSLAYLLAADYATLGDKAKTLEWLGRAADSGVGFEPRNPAFEKFAGDAEFERLRARMEADQAPVLRSRRAFLIERPGLVPEGVAWDAAGRRLFVGDMNAARILAVDAQGRTRDFANGLRLRPLGMKVDAARGRLWVATTNAFWDTPKKEAELVAFDLRTGRVVARHAHAEATSFNDLDIAPSGEIFLTDSDGGGVYRLPADGSAMQRLTPKGAMAYPNGIAWLNGRLYVAQGIALRRVDPATGEIVRVRGLPGFPGLGIDGLYAHRGALIGVQGFGFKGRVSRLELSPEGDAVTAARVLEAANPAFDVPTTAAPAGDRLYVLANSQLDRIRPDGTVAEPRALKPIVILELPLG